MATKRLNSLDWTFLAAETRESMICLLYTSPSPRDS